MRLVALAVLISAFALRVHAQGNGNATYETQGSGNSSATASGSGMVSCSSYPYPCGMNAKCMDVSDSYVCYCDDGYRINNYEDCEKCPAGMWGMDCMYLCDCSLGNGCDRVTGTCQCNPCYTGLNCETPLGADCIRQFLEYPEKSEEMLRELFGGEVHPRPPADTLTSFVATVLMELSDAAVIQMEPEYFDTPRSDVGQGPLIKLAWVVNKNADRPNAERGLIRLTEKVKLGELRCTLIINDLEDTAEVTLNAGVRKDD